jgi:hypothetical protein
VFFYENRVFSGESNKTPSNYTKVRSLVLRSFAGNLNKKVIWVFFCAILILVLFFRGSYVTEAYSTDSGTVLGVVILSPMNQTYSSRFLTLEVTFGASHSMNYSVTYDLDGRYEGSIPWTVKNPTEMHALNPATGFVELRELTEGTHSITVCLEAEGFLQGENPRYYYDFVDFTVDSTYRPVPNPPIDSTPPKVSEVSVENKTYSATDVPLNFVVDENTSRVAYSLDGNENVTLAGNTTLIGLSVGAHNVTVYAWDAAGNIGSSQTVDFVVAEETQSEPEPLPTTLVIVASGISIAGVGLGLLVYFKKRKR